MAELRDVSDRCPCWDAHDRQMAERGGEYSLVSVCACECHTARFSIPGFERSLAAMEGRRHLEVKR